MERECQKYELEIAAAAGGDLAPDTRDHIAECPRCAALRRDTSRLARLGSPRISSEAAVARARAAVRRGGRRDGLPLWAAPLLSASASAAALILYFGLAAAPASRAPAPVVEGSELRSSGERTSVTTLPTLDEMTLPDAFEASYDLLFTGSSQEDES